jgi:TetR/AcrR family transcriptional regulator, transcriptional repressor for nem operon
MNAAPARAPLQRDARTRLLDAAMRVIREQGYSATTVDDICGAAGVTKGAFFHHFKSKEELGVAAATQFAQMAEQLFGGAPYQALPDPLDRLLGYLDFRVAILTGPTAEYTCLFGTLVQEVYETHPAIRQACEASIVRHADRLAEDIAAAKALHAPDAAWSAASLGLYIQAVLQGSFILAKAKGGPQVARDCIGHLRRYVLQLFHQPTDREE